MENRFYKVNQSGGSFIVAGFFNPVTKEYKTECVRDYDYYDCSRDNDELYYMEINDEARKAYLRYCGIIQPGDVVEVVKGRKIPHGTVGTVESVMPIKDRYNRTQAIYAYFTDGQKTNVENLRIIG